MADEAVVRIVLDEKGGAAPPPAAPPRGQAEAFRQGTAMPWAPRDQSIPTPAGMSSSGQAEWLRLESEAARRGQSVKDYKKAEVEARASGSTVPMPPSATTAPEQPPPQPPTTATTDLHEERRLFNEKRAREASDRAAAQVQTAPPEPPKTIPTLPAAPAEVDAFIAKQSVPTKSKWLTSVPPESYGLGAGNYKSQSVEEILDGHAKAEVPTDKATAETQVGPHTYTGLPGSAMYARKKAEAEAEYAKHSPPPPPPPPPSFDPLELAKKRIKAEEQRRLVDIEYAKLKPPPPPQVKSVFDAMLETAESMRGVVGGAFGRVIGLGLDITARLRQARGQAPKAEVPIGEVKAPTASIASDQETIAPAAAPVGNAVAKATGGGEAAEGAALAEASGAAAASMASIVPVVGAVVAAFAAAVTVFNAIVNEANRMADKYGEYNPEIAQAQAQAEIRAIMGDMKRAQRSGEELTEFIKAQSEMQQKWEDVKVALMTKIIPVVTGILQVMTSLLGIASQTDVGEVEDPTRILFGGQAGIGGAAQFGPGRGVSLPGA